MLASDINCLSLIGVEDFYRHLKPGKTIAVCAGTGAVLVSAKTSAYSWTGAFAVFHRTAISAGALAGLFLLAFTSSRASPRGAQIGIAISLVFTLWATLTANGGKALNLGRLNFPLHDYLIGAAGHFVLFACGYVFSFVFPAAHPVDSRLTLAGWLQAARRSADGNAA